MHVNVVKLNGGLSGQFPWELVNLFYALANSTNTKLSLIKVPAVLL